MAANPQNQSEKNKLVPLNNDQVDVYNANGRDFPVSGSSSDLIPAGKPVGWAEGQNKLVDAPAGNRNLEDSGDITPSVWGKGGKTWNVKKNSGESNVAAVAASIPNSVNLQTGIMDGGDPTPVKEIQDLNVHIPARVK
jgi:hypothetical protein